MKEFIINENEAGQRFDKYLAKLLRQMIIQRGTAVDFTDRHSYMRIITI